MKTTTSPLARLGLRAALGLLALAPALATTACQRRAPATPADAPPAAVAAIVRGQPITVADVDKAAGYKLYELREQTLDSLITDRVLDEEAKKAHLSPQAYVSQLVEQRIPQVSEAEAQDWFGKNQARLPQQFQGKKFEEVKQEIIGGLTMMKRRDAAPEIVEDLKKKAGVQVLLTAPKVNVAATGPARGPQGAKVTIVEFSDFQCPFCARGRKTMDQVVQAYGDKVRVVFRDFPLSFHPNAQKAAEAGQCANDQGKFWQMHDWMFDHQSNLAEADLKAAARQLGMDGAKFDQCLTSGSKAKVVADNQQAGSEAGVTGTPAFFVNGTFINGAQPFERFKTEIDRALAP